MGEKCQNVNSILFSILIHLKIESFEPKNISRSVILTGSINMSDLEERRKKLQWINKNCYVNSWRFSKSIFPSYLIFIDCITFHRIHFHFISIRIEYEQSINVELSKRFHIQSLDFIFYFNESNSMISKSMDLDWDCNWMEKSMIKSTDRNNRLLLSKSQWSNGEFKASKSLWSASMFSITCPLNIKNAFKRINLIENN